MKKVLALVVCMMLVLVVGASAKQLSEIKIGYIMKPESNEYWANEKAGVLAWAEDTDFAVVVFPRTKHRPQCYGATDQAQLMVSPGALDMMGLIITPRSEDFNKITAEQARDIIKECGE